MGTPRCIWPGCKAMGKPVKLPLTGKHESLCDLHRGPRFIGHMAGLVAHG